jgi:glycerol-1-phosphate dehydrogenase [NAD(P)+]
VHQVGLDAVVIDEGAIEQLVAYAEARRWSRPFLVMDANTEEVAGSRVKAALVSAGMAVATFCYSERSGLLADEASVSRLEEALGDAETDSLVSVGSGVITDLTRYVAARLDRQFVSVPTAASMDGYASGVAVMEFGGMKTSFPVAPPVAIFAEPATIAAAPLDMTRAGLGDLLGKAAARTDWLAAHGLYGEYLCTVIEKRVTDSYLTAANAIGEILEGSPDAVAGFLRGLVESGVAIALVGTSRPASGSEHQVSHFWDLLAANGWRAHAPHGLQVGYATHFVTRLQQLAFGPEALELVAPRPASAQGEEVRRLFVGHSAQVETVMEQKRRFLIEHGSAWPASVAAWQSARSLLAGALSSFPLVAKALATAGIPPEPGFLDFDVATLKESLRWANRIRPRYSVLDFLEGQGRLDDAIEEVLSQTCSP